MKPLASAAAILERTLFPACLLAIVGILCADIYLRNFFQTGLIWGYDANSYLLLVCVFSILPANGLHDSHLKVDVITQFYSPTQSRLIALATHLIASGLFLLLAYQSIMSAWEMHTYEETPEMIDLPLWILGAFMSLASFVCGLIHLLLLKNQLLNNPNIGSKE